MAHETPDGLSVFASYFGNGKHADLTIKFGTQRVLVHKLLLCAHSAYFRGLLEGGFQEASATEVELKGDDPQALREMLRFFYGIPPSQKTEQGCFDAQMLLNLCVIADKYDIPALRVKTIKVFDTFVKTSLHTSSEAPAIIEAVYTHESLFVEPIKAMIEGACRTHLAGFMLQEDFKDLLLRVPGIAVKLLELSCKKN